jgi:hypothetical protein
MQFLLLLVKLLLQLPGLALRCSSLLERRSSVRLCSCECGAKLYRIPHT